MVCLSVLAGACGSGSPTSPDFVAASQVELQLVDLINAERASRHIDPELSRQQQLEAVARAHSEAMRQEGQAFHVGPDGRDLPARLRDASIVFRIAGENVAMVSNAVDPAAESHRMLNGQSSSPP